MRWLRNQFFSTKSKLDIRYSNTLMARANETQPVSMKNAIANGIDRIKNSS